MKYNPLWINCIKLYLILMHIVCVHYGLSTIYWWCTSADPLCPVSLVLIFVYTCWITMPFYLQFVVLIHCDHDVPRALFRIFLCMHWKINTSHSPYALIRQKGHQKWRWQRCSAYYSLWQDWLCQQISILTKKLLITCLKKLNTMLNG